MSVDGDMGPSDEEGGPNPCPENKEFHKAQDADSMEEAIGKFIEGLEGQERAGFSQIHRLLQRLPAGILLHWHSMTNAEATEEDFHRRRRRVHHDTLTVIVYRSIYTNIRGIS
jgi:hypothetical protein